MSYQFSKEASVHHRWWWGMWKRDMRRDKSWQIVRRQRSENWRLWAATSKSADRLMDAARTAQLLRTKLKSDSKVAECSATCGLWSEDKNMSVVAKSFRWGSKFYQASKISGTSRLVFDYCWVEIKSSYYKQDNEHRLQFGSRRCQYYSKKFLFCGGMGSWGWGALRPYVHPPAACKNFTPVSTIMFQIP